MLTAPLRETGEHQVRQSPDRCVRSLGWKSPEGGDGPQADPHVLNRHLRTNSTHAPGTLDEVLKPSRVSAALLGERESRRMGTEQGFVQPPVPDLAFRESVNGSTQRTPGVGVVQGGLHLRAADGYLLDEHGADEIRPRREMPIDRRDAQTGAPSDLTRGQVQPVRSECGTRDRHDVLPVVFRVRPRFPSRCHPRTSRFPSIRNSRSVSLPSLVNDLVDEARKVIMFAVQFDRFGPPEVLTVGPLPEPHAGSDEVRIRVRAAGVSPVDLALRAGLSPSSERITFPHVPGVDAAGVIDEVGADVTGFAVGGEVFGAVDVSRLGGASAEFAVLRFWARKPSSMSWAEAGAAGTSIETAARALDRLDTRAGTTLLVDGATGGVGSVAVQLAIARGARVIGTGRPESQTFIAGLGAIPVTYGHGLAERVRALDIERVDLALDVAGAGSLPELIAITGTAASVLTIADFTGPELGVSLSLGEFAGEPDGRHGLTLAAALSEERRFRVPVQEVFPMTQAAKAHAVAARGPRQGKIALTAHGDHHSSEQLSVR